MKFLTSAIALLVCLFVPSITNSTCIFIYKDSKGIYVVADTRRSITIVTPNGTTKGYNTIQKINNVGKYYFAISGFDDQALLNAALKTDTSKSLLNNATLYAEQMKAYYTKIMALWKIKQPEKYKYLLQNHLGQTAFFTKEKGSSSLLRVLFKMKENKGLPEISYSIKENLVYVILGHSDHITQLSKPEINKYIVNNPIEGLIRFVKLEMKYHPDGIACPLDVMTWTTYPIITRRSCN